MVTSRGRYVSGLRNDQALAELLLHGWVTAGAAGLLLGFSASHVHKSVRRLRERYGLPVLEKRLDDGRACGVHKKLYHIVMPTGRVCAEPGCGTLLRRTNPSDRCELHGGGVLELGEVTP